MRTFTQKPKEANRTKSAKSTESNRAVSGQSRAVQSIIHLHRAIKHQALQPLLQPNAEKQQAEAASTPFNNDLSRIPIFGRSPLQTQAKLTINTPGDRYEREADRVADQVIRMPEPRFKHAFANSDQFPERQTTQPDQDHESLQTTTQRAAMRIAQPGQTSQLNNSATFEPRIHNIKDGGQPLDNATRSFFEPRFGRDFGHVRVHDNAKAADISHAIQARAFTLGNHIVFGAGQYRPETSEGKRLLGHELVHTLQQDQGGTIRRQPANPVDMPPITIRTGMPSDLSSLSTPVPAGSATVSHGAAALRLNAQLPGTPLPFTSGGWNGADIAAKLGQYDRIPGTDSDAVRCVQAVALMSHILSGPAATIGYLNSISLQGMLAAGRYDTRVRTALRVIEFVTEQIRNRRATYGNMYWAMEAVHDLFYGDASGTPAATPDPMREQIVPMLDLSHNMVDMNVWCSTPADLMTQAATLNPGEQFMLNTWSVSFNYYFDMAGAPATQRRLTYTQTDERNRPLRTVRIQRLDTSTGKPAHTQIDPNRDHKSGHQMLIYKDAADHHIKMYEPEVTTTGAHLFDLTSSQSILTSRIFNDQPAFELFSYVQLLGKIVPAPTNSAFSP